MTTKTYQAQLPYRKYRIVTPRPLPRRPQPPGSDNGQTLADQIKRNIAEVLASGFWFCKDCDCICERIEGEQGQPAHCNRCCSPRIEWNPPVEVALQREVA